MTNLTPSTGHTQSTGHKKKSTTKVKLESMEYSTFYANGSVQVSKQAYICLLWLVVICLLWICAVCRCHCQWNRNGLHPKIAPSSDYALSYLEVKVTKRCFWHCTHAGELFAHYILVCTVQQCVQWPEFTVRTYSGHAQPFTKSRRVDSYIEHSNFREKQNYEN